MRKPILLVISVLLLFLLVSCGSTDFSTLTVGDVIRFGKYDWRVLDVQDGLVNALSIPDDDRNQRLYELDECFYERSPGKSVKFTLIELTLFPGRSTKFWGNP